MDKLIAMFALAIGLLMFIFLFAFLSAFITRIAWEYSVAQIFHLPLLTYWQAYALNILGGMVCKSSSVKYKGND